jgi:DNA-binding NtrC family response regulator
MLLVEDDDRVSRSLVRVASTLGIEIVPTRTLEEARKALETGDFVAVVADLALEAKESGAELLEWLRVNHPRIARVLVSGLPAPENFATAMPMQQFLQKPFGRDELEVLRDSLL